MLFIKDLTQCYGEAKDDIKDSIRSKILGKDMCNAKSCLNPEKVAVFKLLEAATTKEQCLETAISIICGLEDDDAILNFTNDIKHLHAKSTAQGGGKRAESAAKSPAKKRKQQNVSGMESSAKNVETIKGLVSQKLRHFSDVYLRNRIRRSRIFSLSAVDLWMQEQVYESVPFFSCVKDMANVAKLSRKEEAVDYANSRRGKKDDKRDEGGDEDMDDEQKAKDKEDVSQAWNCLKKGDNSTEYEFECLKKGKKRSAIDNMNEHIKHQDVYCALRSGDQRHCRSLEHRIAAPEPTYEFEPVKLHARSAEDPPTVPAAVDIWSQNPNHTDRMQSLRDKYADEWTQAKENYLCEDVPNADTYLDCFIFMREHGFKTKEVVRVLKFAGGRMLPCVLFSYLEHIVRQVPVHNTTNKAQQPRRTSKYVQFHVCKPKSFEEWVPLERGRLITIYAALKHSAVQQLDDEEKELARLIAVEENKKRKPVEGRGRTRKTKLQVLQEKKALFATVRKMVMAQFKTEEMDALMNEYFKLQDGDEIKPFRDDGTMVPWPKELLARDKAFLHGAYIEGMGLLEGMEPRVMDLLLRKRLHGYDLALLRNSKWVARDKDARATELRACLQQIWKEDVMWYLLDKPSMALLADVRRIIKKQILIDMLDYAVELLLQGTFDLCSCFF